MMLFLIILNLAFANQTDFEIKVSKQLLSLKECKFTKTAFYNHLEAMDATVESYATKHNLDEYFHQQTAIGQYLTHLHTTQFPEETSRLARTCWSLYYQFRIEKSETATNLIKNLHQWKACISAQRWEVPSVVQDLINCYKKISNVK